MPIYTLQCPQGHRTEQAMTIQALTIAQQSGNLRCRCGEIGDIVITSPVLVKATPDVCYDSPIDGRPITSMAARMEDLKRNHCVPYDPDIKQDADRRVRESEEELDRSIEATVEEEITKMDGRKRATLASELLDQGVTADIVRSTSHG